MTHVFICVRNKFECLSGMTQPNPIFLKAEGEIYLEIAMESNHIKKRDKECLFFYFNLKKKGIEFFFSPKGPLECFMFFFFSFL